MTVKLRRGTAAFRLEALETRTLLSVDGWQSYALNPQHTALSTVASQPLQGILWHTPVDTDPQYSSSGELLIHYGSPLITAANTVILPVKTGVSGPFEVEALSGYTGAQEWTLTSNYVLPPSGGSAGYDWTPNYSPTLTPSNGLYFPELGGTVGYTASPDAPGPTAPATSTFAFFGMSNYNANPSAYNSTVFINTPITTDSSGDIFFGFQVAIGSTTGLTSGIARIDADGTGTWTPVVSGMTQVATNSAPALSNDGNTLYVLESTGNWGSGKLVALNSHTLAVTASVSLVDPHTGDLADITNDATAAPMVGPDGDVYVGVLESPFASNNDRGWLLHFSGDLSVEKTPGAFGWDDTPSVVPASMVPSYHGTSTYLLMTKYNNYAGLGSGNGINKIAILDPNATETDPVTGTAVMNEVLTIAGPTPDPDNDAKYPGAVREWCINDAVVDPATDSILVNSEDGNLYRWNLTSNSFTQQVTLTSGVGEAYTPTLIGPDGTVYAINNATLFAVGDTTTASFKVTGYPTPVTAGTPGNFTVSAYNSYGDLMTGYTGTVQFTSSDPQAVLPADYPFVAADHGTYTFAATLKTAGTQYIAATDTTTSSITGTQSGIVVQAAGAQSLAITGLPASVTAGVANNFTVTAYDPYGNVATDYTGTVHFTSTDPSAALPADYSFTSGNAGTMSFTAILNTVGTQTIFAADTLTASIKGSAIATVNATIFGNTTPSNTSEADSSAVELGVKFESSVAGYIDGIRFYKGSGNTGTHVGYLWTNTGTLLAMATFSGETASGWQQVNFGTPVAISANTIYVASYLAPAGHYADDQNYFVSSGVTSGPLTALSNTAAGGNGVYLYGLSGAFPSNTYRSSNYYVDVVFSTGSVSPATKLVIQTQPSATATAGVAFATQPVIYEEDQNGNLETGDNSTVVTVALNTGTGPLQGTLTATVHGGIATFTNLADNTAETITLNFTSPGLTTATSNNIVVANASTIFGNTTPSNTSEADSSAVELGVKFESSVAGYIDGIRFYKGSGNTGTHVGYLWTNTGTLLAMATFSGETASGWQQVNFGTPVAISANTIYVASYLAPAGHYADDQNYFVSSGVTSGPLTALSNTAAGGNGVYLYGLSGAFPSNTYRSSNYYVDVVFSTGSVSPATKLVIQTQPSATATAGVAFATQPVIYEEDQNGNLETGDNSTVVTVALNTGTGPLQGTLTATVHGGIATFTNLADNTAETITLNFTSPGLTTATSNNIVVANASTIFGNTTPSNTSEADSSAVELGVKFESSVAGYIDGIRFYKGSGNTGTHVGYLWTNTGTLLAMATFSGETASGWQQVNFGTPVAISANTIYVASYLAPAGHYADDQNYFVSSGVTSGPLTALSNTAAGGNGVYLYGLSGAFPSNTYRSSNYYVDVVFSTAMAPAAVSETAAADPIAGNHNVVRITTNKNGNTAALDAVVARWTSIDSSTRRISKIMSGVGTGDVVTLTSSNGGSQTQNNPFLILTSLPADKVRKKPGQSDTNL